MVSVALTLNQSASANSLGSHPGCQANQTPLSATLRRGSTPQQTTVAFVEALDHLSTKLKIPMSAVEPTNALQDDGLVPGICRLYLEGRCRQGSRCFQVHAAVMFWIHFVKKRLKPLPAAIFMAPMQL
ncbi:hypothetical protein TcBrA4_0093100 [Trypanosoma cruzi]|nr:hypothetical protein TcBrA4_0093100 [Trypanosoma cruzi]